MTLKSYESSQTHVLQSGWKGNIAVIMYVLLRGAGDEKVAMTVVHHLSRVSRPR
jgi:hypothetical protein